MKTLKPFQIAFVGLSRGMHEFQMEIGADFFSCFEGSEVEKGDLTLKLLMNKKSNMLDLEFQLSGDVELTCDRCLETYQQSLEDQRMLYVKFGESREELSDEILVIPTSESHVDISQYVYEYIMLALPAKRVHPGGEGAHCDAETLKSLEKYLLKQESAGVTSEPDKAQEPDSRWDALKNLKFEEEE